MDLTVLFVGLFFIILGVLIYFFPNLIAGYNTMSKEAKKQVDIKGLSRLMRNSFIIFGIYIIVIYYTLSYLGKICVAENIIPVSIPIFVLIIFIFAQKHNKRSWFSQPAIPQRVLKFYLNKRIQVSRQDQNYFLFLEWW